MNLFDTFHSQRVRSSQRARSRAAVALLAALSGLALSSDADAFRVIGAEATDGTYCSGALLQCGSSATVVRWHRNFVPFAINSQSAADADDATLTQGEIIGAAQAAYQSWEDVDGAILNFVYAGETGNRLSGADRTNTTLWYNSALDSGSCAGALGSPSGTLAITVLTEIVESGEITDCDVIFDSADTWDWNADCSSFEVQTVLAHEYGHSIGIHHSELSGAMSVRPTMNGTYFCDAGIASGRSLEEDDEDAARCLYPDLPTVILMDKTGSMNAGNRMVDAKEAANFFVDNFKSVTMAVAEFADPATGCESNVGYELVQDWTSDTAALHAAINSVTACGGTPLYESLCCAIDKAVTMGPANVLVFTDTGENSSNGGCGCSDYVDTFTKAMASDVRFYVVDMTDYAGTAPLNVDLAGDPPAARSGGDGSNLSQLAFSTGGLYFKTDEPFALTSARANIEAHLRQFGHEQQNPVSCFPTGPGLDKIQEYAGNCNPNSPFMGTGQVASGRVTVEPGTFGEDMFYIQDCTGGIRVRSDLSGFPIPRLGQEIALHATVGNVEGEVTLENVVEFGILDEEPTEMPVPVVEVGVGGVCEMIGQLLTFRGFVANEVNRDGEFLLVSDLEASSPEKLVVEIDPNTDIDTDSIVEGDYIFVTGVLGTEFGQNRVRPRSSEDIEVSGAADVDFEPIARIQSMIESVRPNPSRDSFQIRFAMANEGDVAVEVFDAQGRVVQSLAKGSRPAGSHVVIWDGRSVDGAPSPSGMYFVRVSSAGKSESKSLLLLR